MKATMTHRTFMFGVLMSLLTSSAMAQSYYDDDIYFDADKAKKEKTEKARLAAEKEAKRRAAQEAHDRYLENLVDTEAGSDRAVDEYNRRNGYTPVKEKNTDLGDNFTYTRRIERFSNPDIVVNSNDDDLKYLYTYANDELAGATGSTSPTTINIYVDNIDPWDNFWNPYYYTSAWSWAWRPAYYNPWWGYNYWSYGPSWSWSWGHNHLWGPSWSWGWHHGPHWGWNPPRPPHHPVNPPHPGHRPGNSGYIPGGRGGRSGGRMATTGGGYNSSNVGRRLASNQTTRYPVAGQGQTSNKKYNTNVSTSGRRTSSGTVYGNGSRRNSGSTGYNPSNATRHSSSSSSSSSNSYNRGRSSYGNRSSSGSSYNSGRSSYGNRSSSGATRSGGGGRSGGRK